GAPVILNVPHEGAAGSLLPEDNVMELTCRVDAAGVHPLPLTKPIPEHIRSWIEAVKAYELKTVDAALAGDRESAIQALAANPLVPGHDVARLLVERRASEVSAPPFSDRAS
ncbi:MAG: 6-phospho-beta-glucosidase, partial [Clostridia bacterium]